MIYEYYPRYEGAIQYAMTTDELLDMVEEIAAMFEKTRSGTMP